MTDMTFTFNKIISTNRTPKNCGDYDYILDISNNILYDISANIIYDKATNTIFYKLVYYKKFLLNCINNVSITTTKGNYIYLFLINELINNIPLCKIGFTSDEYDRTMSLCKKIKKSLKLLCIIPVIGQFQEKSLHNYLKLKCPYCIMEYKYPDGTIATEIYKLHPNLIHELYYYIKHIELLSKNDLLIKQEETKQLTEQTKQIEYIEKTKQTEYIEKTKQTEYIEKTKQTEYIEKTKQEKEKTNQEKEKTKQLKLQLEILKLQQKNNITL